MIFDDERGCYSHFMGGEEEPVGENAVFDTIVDHLLVKILTLKF